MQQVGLYATGICYAHVIDAIRHLQATAVAATVAAWPRMHAPMGNRQQNLPGHACR